MWNKRKIFFVATLSGMSMLTIGACRWQYYRYYQSLKKWERLDEQFAKELPEELSLDNKLPWSDDVQEQFKVDDFEYRLVRVGGILRVQRFFVHRAQDGRPGYFIIAPLSGTKKEPQVIAVNLGWIPSSLKKQFENEKRKEEEVSIVALLKRPEKVDQVNLSKQAQVMHQHIQNQSATSEGSTTEQSMRFNSFIDLASFKNILNCNLDQTMYLDKFLLSSENAFDSEGHLYPVSTSKSTFSKPYLTPDKHLSYSTFWGCCSAFGIFTVLKVIFTM